MISGLLASVRRRHLSPAGPIVNNGTFDSNLMGWTSSVDGAAEWVAPGRMRVKDLGSYAGVEQVLSIAAGVERTIGFECTAFAGLYFQVGLGFNFGDTTFFAQSVFAAGAFGSISFTPTISNSVLWIRSLGGRSTDTADFDAISIV